MNRIAVAAAILSTLAGQAAAQSLGPTQSAKPLKNFGLPESVAPAAAGGTLNLVYRATGIKDNGQEELLGVATIVLCTNFSTITESIRLIINDYGGTVAADLTVQLRGRWTASFVTHRVRSFNSENTLNTGGILQGSLFILATTTNLVCTASVIDAASTVPYGMDLHMQRFSPHPGAVE